MVKNIGKEILEIVIHRENHIKWQREDRIMNLMALY
jgi:hypothetical protein